MGTAALANTEKAVMAWCTIPTGACRKPTREAKQRAVRDVPPKDVTFFSNMASALIDITKDVMLAKNEEELDEGIERTLASGNHIKFCENGLRSLVETGLKSFMHFSGIRTRMQNATNLISDKNNRSLIVKSFHLQNAIIKCSRSLCQKATIEEVFAAIKDAEKDPLGFVYDPNIPSVVSQRMFDGFSSTVCLFGLAGSLICHKDIPTSSYELVLRKLVSNSRSYLGFVSALVNTKEFDKYLEKEDFFDLEKVRRDEPLRRERLELLRSSAVLQPA